MKNTLFVAPLLIAIATIVLPVYSQVITKDDWQREMLAATAHRDELKTQVANLEREVAALKEREATVSQSLKACKEQLFALLGRSEDQAKEFTKLLDGVDAQLAELSKVSNQRLWERRAELDSLQATLWNAHSRRLALLQKNRDRLQNHQRQLDMLRNSMKNHNSEYIVGTWRDKRDCLWNIAAKPNVYGSPFLWPKIWQENRNKIKNPDIIHPGQRLKLPPKQPLTAWEEAAAQSYWARKQKEAGSLSVK